MERSVFNLTQDSPNRPPDWRSEFARRIVESRDPVVTLYHTTETPDPPLIFYVRHLHNLWTRPTDGILLADGWTGPGDREYGDGVAEAEVFRKTASPWSQALLEAWLLARMTDEEVAAKTGLRPAAVKWYERLYFHCRDRLDGDGYVRHVLFRSWAVTPTPADVIKTYAYYGGPATVELVLEHWDGNPRPVWDKPDPNLDPKQNRQRQRVLLTVMLRLLPMKERTTVRDLRELLRIQELMKFLEENPEDPNNEFTTAWSDFFRAYEESESESPESEPESSRNNVGRDEVEKSTLEIPEVERKSGARRRAQHSGVSAR